MTMQIAISGSWLDVDCEGLKINIGGVWKGIDCEDIVTVSGGDGAGAVRLKLTGGEGVGGNPGGGWAMTTQGIGGWGSPISCNCFTSPGFVFDDAATPDTIAPGGNITVTISGGCWPYAGTCGVEFDPYATINVTDTCGSGVEIVIRNTGGQWNQIGNVYNGNNNCASSFICPHNKTVFYQDGNQLWSLAVITGAFSGECPCVENSANWNVGWLDGAGATFPPMTPYTFWNTYYRVDPPICGTCTGAPLEGSPNLVRGYYYEWGC